MGYSISGTQENCYPGTTVLINKLNIRNQNELDEIERQLFVFASLNIEKNVIFENVDFEFYKNLHKQLFSELYEWAGTVRKIDISKKGTRFCNFKEIENLGKLIFKRLLLLNYFKELDFDEFVDELSLLYNDLNVLHPFREGNGRTLRLFITLLVRNAGYDIDFYKCDNDLLMIATIKAVQGDIFMLNDIFRSIIKLKGENNDGKW